MIVVPFMLGGVHRLVTLRARDLTTAFGIPLAASALIGVVAHFGASAWESQVPGPQILGLGVVALAAAAIYFALIRVAAPALFDEATEVLGSALPSRLRRSG